LNRGATGTLFLHFDRFELLRAVNWLLGNRLLGSYHSVTAEHAEHAAIQELTHSRSPMFKPQICKTDSGELEARADEARTKLSSTCLPIES
jgi:hypothetical protein